MLMVKIHVFHCINWLNLLVMHNGTCLVWPLALFVLMILAIICLDLLSSCSFSFLYTAVKNMKHKHYYRTLDSNVHLQSHLCFSILKQKFKKQIIFVCLGRIKGVMAKRELQSSSPIGVREHLSSCVKSNLHLLSAVLRQLNAQCDVICMIIPSCN